MSSFGSADAAAAVSQPVQSAAYGPFMGMGGGRLDGGPALVA